MVPNGRRVLRELLSWMCATHSFFLKHAIERNDLERLFAAAKCYELETCTRDYFHSRIIYQSWHSDRCSRMGQCLMANAMEGWNRHWILNVIPKKSEILDVFVSLIHWHQESTTGTRQLTPLKKLECLNMAVLILDYSIARPRFSKQKQM